MNGAPWVPHIYGFWVRFGFCVEGLGPPLSISTIDFLDHMKCKLYIKKALVENQFNESTMANFVLELM